MPWKQPKPDPFRRPPIELTSELAVRFRALDTPTDTEQPCSVCHAGRDVPKVGKRDRLICVVCNVMLGQMTPARKGEGVVGWSGPDEMV